MIIRKATLDGFIVSEDVYEGGAVMPPHEDSQTHLAFILSGSLQERAEQRDGRYPAFWMVNKPAGLRHANRFGPQGTRMLRISFVPGTRSRPASDWRDRTYLWRDGIRQCALFLEIRAELWSEDGPSTLTLESLCHEAIDVAVGRSRDDTPRRTDTTWLARCIDILRARRTQTVRLHELAAACGVHEVHVARTFRRNLGCSVGEFMRRLRIEQAVEQMSESSHSLCRIALDAGFADQAHFCRVFKGYTGVTPAQYRRHRLRPDRLRTQMSTNVCRTQSSRFD